MNEGQRFGYLIVDRAFQHRGLDLARCACDCGNEIVIEVKDLQIKTKCSDKCTGPIPPRRPLYSKGKSKRNCRNCGKVLPQRFYFRCHHCAHSPNGGQTYADIDSDYSYFGSVSFECGVDNG